MKKVVLLLSPVLIICAVCFIPVTEQKTMVIKATFFNVYQQLINGNNWKNWRTDLQQRNGLDSTAIVEKKTFDGYKLSYRSLKINVIPADGYSFHIIENVKNNYLNYSYTAFPAKSPDETTFIVTHKTDILHFVLDHFKRTSFSQTHSGDLKNFMESTRLYYGYDIIKGNVVDTAFIVLRKISFIKNKFADAAGSLNVLNNYIASNGLKQTRPLIAQFLPKNVDSIQLNVGIPVSKRTLPKKPLDFMMMPANATIYILNFNGQFSERTKAYTAAKRYFNDKHITLIIAPFERYLDNKMPQNDTDKVNIQINFPSF